MRRLCLFLLATGCTTQFTQEDAQAFANELDASTASGVSGNTPLLPLVPPPFDSTVACAEGGRSGVAGNVTGSLDQFGNGSLYAGFVATFTDCQDNGVVFNGDPYLSATGSMSFSNGQMTSGSLSFGGALRWDQAGGSGSCNVNLSLILASQTSTYSHLSGTVCGFSVEVYR
jgi:hypothetical protein